MVEGSQERILLAFANSQEASAGETPCTGVLLASTLAHASEAQTVQAP